MHPSVVVEVLENFVRLLKAIEWTGNAQSLMHLQCHGALTYRRKSSTFLANMKRHKPMRRPLFKSKRHEYHCRVDRKWLSNEKLREVHAKKYNRWHLPAVTVSTSAKGEEHRNTIDPLAVMRAEPRRVHVALVQHGPRLTHTSKQRGSF